MALVPRRVKGVDPQYGAPTKATPKSSTGVDPQYGAPIGTTGFPGQRTASETPGGFYSQAGNPWEKKFNDLQEQMNQMAASFGSYAPPAAPEIDQDLESRALQAALDRIGAEYGIRIAEPQGELNSLGGQYQNAMLENKQMFGDARRQQDSQIAGRGLLRSGVRNTEMQRAFNPIERQRRDIQNTMAYGEGVDEKDYGTQALQLEAAIEQLRAAQKNAELERRLEAERSGLTHDLAVANPGG